jgi:hypothetical protein
MAERPDIPDALREAVERTVQATTETRDRARGRAQDAVDDLAGTVDEMVRGAERNISAGRRSVRAVVGERLPATQEDVKALHAELRTIARRLDAIEERLPAPRSEPAAKRKPAARKPAAKKPKR